MNASLVRTKHFAIILLTSAASFAAARAQPSAPAAPASSGQQFVQQFYDWYIPKAPANGAGPAWEIALQDKGADFDQSLATEINNDIAAQKAAATSGSDVGNVGLDFDPFLNSQDPCDHYKAGSADWKGQTLEVSVYCVDANKPSANPDVVAELSFANGTWRFINFIYPGVSDLVKTLGLLKAARVSH